MRKPTFSQGKAIETRCTKCRKTTSHLILAMNDATPGKVLCNICGRQHDYQTNATTQKTAVRQNNQLKAAERKEWEELQPTIAGGEATDYSMTAHYKIRSLINHPTFGFGFVQRIVGPQKIEILFEDGKKTMRCK